MKIRIKFSKQGPVRFIGHLDVMRYFQKVMRRANVDIRYSEGFSPHQIMSFASPLSVGLTSRGEYMDIEVHSTGSSAQMVERLNAVSAEGIRVLSYRLLDDTAKNAMSLVAAADYTLWFKEGYGPDSREGQETFFQELLAFCRRETIETVKQTKKGERIMDLRPLIYEAHICSHSMEEDDADGSPSHAIPAFFLRLSAGSVENIKPEQVLTAFYQARGEIYSPFALQVEREEVYGAEEEDGEGSPAGRRLVPLEAYGSEIREAIPRKETEEGAPSDGGSHE